MARYRSDIPNGYDDMSHVGYWTPETPEFLEKRDERRAAQRSSAVSYTQAKANIRRISIQNQAASSAEDRLRGSAPIIDFEQLERARYGRGASAVPHERAANRPRRDVRMRAEVSVDRERPSARGGRSGYRFNAEVSVGRRASTPSGARRVPARSRRDDYGYRADAFAEERFDEYGDYSDEPARPTLRSRLSKVRHDMRARKADRTFSRDYADAPAPLDEGPRAAVYEGRMGRQHQRASRMQAVGKTGGFQMPAFITGIIEAVPFEKLLVHRWFLRTVVTAVCVTFIAVNLFPAAQGYYLQSRANDQMAAEYQAIVERNAELEQHVEALRTDEGMEELAHESLGWVREGENSVSVITDGSAAPSSGALGDVEAIPEGSVPTPETWYSPVLDVVFGYEG